MVNCSTLTRQGTITVSPVLAMDHHQGHRMSLFPKNHHQLDNSQKPLFMTPQPRHSEKQSTVSVFSNSLQRPFAHIRNSGITDSAISRDLVDSSLHLSALKFNRSASQSRAPAGSPSSQHSSPFYDNKGGFLMKVRCSATYTFKLGL
jgi:hypothetical protein